jgi:hypothetical protein
MRLPSPVSWTDIPLVDVCKDVQKAGDYCYGKHTGREQRPLWGEGVGKDRVFFDPLVIGTALESSNSSD